MTVSHHKNIKADNDNRIKRGFMALNNTLII